ncbi:MAG: adenylate/guanylate cyclase domain-containing protein [Pseudomonadota bacterium]|nr:adenylate/guanylate cyclase domain-containing protein [Pseudomonadota bacterium]
MIFPHCRGPAPATAAACPRCAGGLGGASAAAGKASATRARSAQHAHPPIERRPLTVMFCDLADAVSLAQRLDAEDLMALIERYQTLCDDIVKDRGGFLAKFMGDGVLAYFGHPRTAEDDAANAVAAGLEIVAAVRELERKHDMALEARVGIATGLVVVRGRASRARQRTVEVVGRILNLALRLQSAAPPGAVLIADATRKVTRGPFNYQDLGQIGLRGFPQPVQAWRVEQKNAAVSRFQAPMLGQTNPSSGRAGISTCSADAWPRRAKAGARSSG